MAFSVWTAGRIAGRQVAMLDRLAQIRVALDAQAREKPDGFLILLAQRVRRADASTLASSAGRLRS
jgi:hypothetical protein